MISLSNLNTDKKEKLAYLCGYLISDGHLQNKGWRHLISFYSKNDEEINIIKTYFEDIFNIQGKNYPDSRKKSMNRLFFHSKDIANFFQKLGIPEGNKTNNPFKVPNWLIRENRHIKSAFLRAMFDCEGCIYCTKGRNLRWRVALEMYKNKTELDSGLFFFTELKDLLYSFNISTSPIRTKKGNKRKDGSESIAVLFEIEYPSFQNFYKYIGFYNKDKQNRLLSALRSASL